MRSWRSGLPFLVTRDDLPEMRQLVKRLTARTFDIVRPCSIDDGADVVACGARRVFDAHNAVWTIVGSAADRCAVPQAPVSARSTTA